MKASKTISMITAAVVSATLLSGCGLSSAPAMTVNGYKINKLAYSNFLSEGISVAQSKLLKSIDKMTDSDKVDGKPYKDFIISYANDLGKEYALEDTYFDTAGLTFDDKDRTTLGQYTTNIADNYKGQSNLDAALKEQGLTMSELEEYYRHNIKVTKLSDSLFGEKGTVEALTDAKLKEIFKSDYYRVKHILLQTKDNTTGKDLDESAVKQKEATYNDLLTKAQNGENFDSLVSTHSEDPGSTSQKDGYFLSKYTTNYDSIFTETSLSLKENEIKGCKTQFGFHIIKRYPIDADTTFDSQKATVKSEVQKFKLKQYVQSQAKNPKVSINKSVEEKYLKEIIDNYKAQQQAAANSANNSNGSASNSSSSSANSAAASSSAPASSSSAAASNSAAASSSANSTSSTANKPAANSSANANNTASSSAPAAPSGNSSAPSSK
ncbi:MAG: peptidylprolyl isomerase [Bacillota bacterium]|nr:peptidylprolyl isomerase [Bacillota bacterium]